MDPEETQMPVTKGYISTSLPYVFCSKLPPHWRCNKSLREPFAVLLLDPIPNGTKVAISAWNDVNPSGEVRNAIARIQNKIAKFNDLRFVGKSGRDRKFNLRITIASTPEIVATVDKAIKVTADGPRESRRKKATPSPATPPSTPPLLRPIPILPQIVVAPPILNPPINFMQLLPAFGLSFHITPLLPIMPLFSDRTSSDSQSTTGTSSVSGLSVDDHHPKVGNTAGIKQNNESPRRLSPRRSEIWRPY